MKASIIKSIAIAAVFTLSTSAFAQTAKTEAPASTTKPATGVALTPTSTPTEDQKTRAEKNANKIAELVKITDEQKKKLQAGFLDLIMQEDQQRAEAKGDAKKLEEVAKNHDSKREARLKAVLTPKQYNELVAAGEKLKAAKKQ